MKKIFKRLLSVMLALVMVVGMVPITKVETVMAMSAGDKVYFDTTNTGWFADNSCVPYVIFKNGTGQGADVTGWTKMENVKDTVYGATIPKNATYVQFARSANGTDLYGGTTTISLDQGTNNCFKASTWSSNSSYWENGGEWVSYTESGSGTGSGESGGDSGSDSNVIYLDASETNFDTAGATFAVKVSGGGLDEKQIAMTKVYPNNSNDHYYKVEIPSGYTRIAFLRCDANGNTGWGNLVNYNSWPQIPTNGNNCYVASAYNANGTWTTYSGENTGTATESIFYVQTDLVDYLNDWRVRSTDDQHRYRNYNQGDQVSMIVNNGVVNGDSSPYSYLNQEISEQGYVTPLYFGPLYLIQMRYGRETGSDVWLSLSNWNTGANVAPATSSGEANYSASVQGLVGNSLKNGNLTDTSGEELLYFSKTEAVDYAKNFMEYYSGLEFPFKATYDNATGVTTYSYDSAKDYAVYYDYETKRLQMSDEHITNMTQDADGNKVNGYYPLNKPGDTGSAINMGFGTKFTIPFTVSDDGKINGKDVTFNFTGDDDVWVFIDNQLVLDMGGAHTMSTGSINFATLQATVDNAYSVKTNQTITGDTWKSENYIGKDLSDYLSDNNTVERDKASRTGQVTTDFPTDLQAKFKDEYANNKAEVHTLTMFYMERGMFDSNMSISFTMSPIPSGLVVSADLDTSNINPGLVSSVENVDEFSYSVVAKMLKNNSDVAWDSYVLTDHNSVSTTETPKDSIITGVRNDRYASTFLNGKNNAFVAGTGFTITEKIENTVFQYDNGATLWNLYDADNSYKKIDGEISLESTFNMGTAESDSTTDSYNYSLNYVNKIKVGDLKLTKEFPNSDSETEYEFTLLLDLDGEGNTFISRPYTGVNYTSSNGKNENGTTDEYGKFTIKAGETVTFSGIPLGATYSIEETAPTTGDTWKISSITGANPNTKNEYLATGSISDTSQNVTFKNQLDSVELDKVIYIESNSDGGTTYTVKDSSDADGDKKVTVTTLKTADLPEGTTATTNSDGSVTYKTGTDDTGTGDTGITVSVSDGSVVLKTENAGKKYVIPYTGTKDGTNVYGKITVFTYKATNKVYVFDYGLKSDLAATNKNGDGLFEGGVFYNENATDANATTATFSNVTGDDNVQTKIEASATVEINKDGSANGSVTFTPVAFMSAVENYTYTADIVKKDTTFDSTNPETGTVVNGTIKVMPASVVYYEDNFNSDSTSTDSTAKIIYSGDEKNIETAGTSLTLTQSNGQTEQYGHDNAYNTTGNQQDSGGSSTKLTADGYNTTAVFTFTGTGFDILARTTDETAGIVYTIEKYDKGTGRYSLYRMGAVDTYYTNGDLYQLPVIHEDVEYGTYCVTLGIKQTGAYYQVVDEAGRVIQTVDTRKYFVYLDGIRIYNPLGVRGDDDYIASEQDATVSAISKLVVGKGTVTETGVRDEYGSTINGQVIDGANVAIVGYSDKTLEPLGSMQTEVSTEDSGTSTASILTYLNAGPNNEVYMDETAAMAFVVKATGETTNTLQVEVKLADTSNSKGSESCDGIALRVLSKNNDTIEETVVENIKTSTAMYYSIDVEKDCIALCKGYYLVVILGNSDFEGGGTHSLSFSNLKYKNYTIGNPYDTSDYDASAYIEASGDTTTTKFVSIDAMTGLKKNTWYRYKHTVTLTENVFGVESVDDENGNQETVQRDPEFKMYYTNAADEMVEISVKAKRVENSDGTYSDTDYILQFKTPNAKGNFPIEIHYVVTSYEEDENGDIVEKKVESEEYISTTMVTK